MIQFSIYNKHNLLVLFSMFLLLGCSCTPTPIPATEVEGIKPIWATKLPGKAGIYNDGLIGLPIYNGKIMFHSTYSTNLENEDNRVHALDMETGEISWTLPAKQLKEKALLFGGVPFQYNEFIVTKMRKYGSVSTAKLMCINMKTKQEMWYKEIPYSNSYNTNPDVVGNGTGFYYFEQTRESAILCKGNVVSEQSNAVLEILPEHDFNYTNVTSNVIFHKEKNLIIAGAWERDTTNSDFYSYKNYLYIIDIEKNSMERKILVERNYKNNLLIARIYCIEDRVFAAYGLSTICYNLNTQAIEWTYNSTESHNYMTNDVIVNNNTVFLFGSNRYVGLDANTGKKLYQGDIQCGNANAFNGYVYVIGRDAKLYILDIKTGKTLHRIICPEEYTSRTGFNTYCKPQMYGDKLYVFGNYHAYCYDAVPKEE